MEAEFLYNPAGTGLHSHAPTIVMRSGGDLLAAWYAYSEREREDASLIVARRTAGQGWQPGREAVGRFNHSVGNPVLFETPDGNVWLLYVVIKGTDWMHAELMGTCSKDGGYTWTRPRLLHPDQGRMVRHPPVALLNNSLLLPAYDENSRQSVMLTAREPYSEWFETYRFDDPPLIQPVMVRERSGALALLFRPTGEPRTIWRSRSVDEGTSWSPPVRTPLPTSLSGIGAFSVSDQIGVVYNHTTEHKRYPLSIAWSRDSGVTWSKPWHIDTAKHEVSYPSFITGSDGRVHGVYTYNRRMIKYVAFSPKRIG